MIKTAIYMCCKHTLGASNLKSAYLIILVTVAFSIVVSEVCLIDV